MLRTAPTAAVTAFFVVIAFVFGIAVGRETLRAEIARTIASGFAAMNAPAPPFRIHARDVITRSDRGSPIVIRCPKCAGGKYIQGIACPLCLLSGEIGVNAFDRQVVEIPDSERSDYAWD